MRYALLIVVAVVPPSLTPAQVPPLREATHVVRAVPDEWTPPPPGQSAPVPARYRVLHNYLSRGVPLEVGRVITLPPVDPAARVTADMFPTDGQDIGGAKRTVADALIPRPGECIIVLQRVDSGPGPARHMDPTHQLWRVGGDGLADFYAGDDIVPAGYLIEKGVDWTALAERLNEQVVAGQFLDDILRIDDIGERNRQLVAFARRYGVQSRWGQEVREAAVAVHRTGHVGAITDLIDLALERPITGDILGRYPLSIKRGRNWWTIPALCTPAGREALVDRLTHRDLGDDELALWLRFLVASQKPDARWKEDGVEWPRRATADEVRAQLGALLKHVAARPVRDGLASAVAALLNGPEDREAAARAVWEELNRLPPGATRALIFRELGTFCGPELWTTVTGNEAGIRVYARHDVAYDPERESACLEMSSTLVGRRQLPTPPFHVSEVRFTPRGPLAGRPVIVVNADDDRLTVNMDVRRRHGTVSVGGLTLSKGEWAVVLRGRLEVGDKRLDWTSQPGIVRVK